jgi:hypothetical protein
VIVTWEYPPRLVGDMAHHVEQLILGLNKTGISTSIVSCHESPYKHEQRSELLEIFWASNPVNPHISVITWCLTLNSDIERIISDIYYKRNRKIDLLDVNDWHFISASTNLKRALGIPFIFTVHSLEDQRSLDSTTPLSSCIKGLERMGAEESDMIITKSDLMKEKIVKIHNISPSKIAVISPTEQNWIKETLKSYKKTRRIKGD